ncbi:Zinc-binding alcohol dehydrogenase domain-containing protein 2-like [Plakobranchus ocellatus]|uniref:15-oxoprostaglandin 13-reductase n=1 Tax=Plakobranchus ocellatus TaxID=259542 RepID=A0AAV3ZYJ5_9GAST|nr:Zinc-binding alcohol dehydrogenase domain-containing protein 2-like [Plakobranchus ocellatus]
MATTAANLPAKMKEIQIVKLGDNFREVTKIVEVPVPKPGPRQVVIKTSFLAVNISDILYTLGEHTPGVDPPFPAGLEGMGEIVAVGRGSTKKVGQTVAFFAHGAFREYVVVNDFTLVPTPNCTDPAYLVFPVSAITASAALEKKGNLQRGETVLVTAAAGAVGHIAVQLAKAAGCRVIGTCSSDDKVAYLKSIGCDRPINYNKESVADVLKREYPKGINTVFESVGGEMLDIALQNLAFFGRIIVLGTTSAHSKNDGTKSAKPTVDVPSQLLLKSADMNTLNMVYYKSEIPKYIQQTISLYQSKKLKLATDNGEKEEYGPFRGLEKVYDAMDYMFSKKSIGKVVISMGDQ